MRALNHRSHSIQTSWSLLFVQEITQDLLKKQCLDVHINGWKLQIQIT